MARKPMPWFRVYVETMHDRKIRRLKPEHRWLWIVVLAMTRQSPVEGALMISETEPAQAFDLADMAGLTERQTAAGLEHMEQVGLIERCPDSGTWTVPAWSSRQFASDNRAGT